MENFVYDLDPEWTVAIKYPCGHRQYACCREHLDSYCQLCDKPQVVDSPA